MPRILKIEKDMDAAIMAQMRGNFARLAEIRENLEIDMKNVKFIDGSGIGGLVFLYKRLRANGHSLTVRNVGGQPLRLFHHLRMQNLIVSNLHPQAV